MLLWLPSGEGTTKGHLSCDLGLLWQLGIFPQSPKEPQRQLRKTHPRPTGDSVRREESCFTVRTRMRSGEGLPKADIPRIMALRKKKSN